MIVSAWTDSQSKIPEIVIPKMMARASFSFAQRFTHKRQGCKKYSHLVVHHLVPSCFCNYEGVGSIHYWALHCIDFTLYNSHSQGSLCGTTGWVSHYIDDATLNLFLSWSANAWIKESLFKDRPKFSVANRICSDVTFLMQEMQQLILRQQNPTKGITMIVKISFAN